MMKSPSWKNEKIQDEGRPGNLAGEKLEKKKSKCRRKTDSVEDSKRALFPNVTKLNWLAVLLSLKLKWDQNYETLNPKAEERVECPINQKRRNLEGYVIAPEVGNIFSPVIRIFLLQSMALIPYALYIQTYLEVIE